MAMKVYRVTGAATGAGVYVCQEQQLVSANWGETSGDKFTDLMTGDPPELVPAIEVLHLLESNAPAGATRALVVNDKMYVWEMKDCAGETFRIGKLALYEPRMFRATADSGGSNHLTCNMVPDGETPVASGLGYHVEVYFKTTEGVNINMAIPKFALDEDLFAVWQPDGKFYYVDVLQKDKDCTPPE